MARMGWALRLGATVLLAGSLLLPTPRPLAAETAPNIVLIVTDDQRWDTLWAMPHVQSDLVSMGVQFTNAFVVNSLCCPSRASILTGQYSHTTLVYDDGGQFGGFGAFHDEQTVATWLHSAGYHTGLIGKYLNGYRRSDSAYIPPGWDRWFTILQGRNNTETSYYYDYFVSDQGTRIAYGQADADYSTDVFSAQADSFIREASPDQPLFLYFAPSAPHEPAKPPSRYADSFSDLTPFRPPSYNEQDVSDKPAYIRKKKLLSTDRQVSLDALRVNQYRTLLAVDDALATIETALTDTGRLTNTMIVFASDNGYMWGEHRASGKVLPYEESIRIPLVIRYDPLVVAPGTDDHLVTNLDLASTFTELSGAIGEGMEGQSLLSLLSRTPVDWRDAFLVEHLFLRGALPSYCVARSEGFMYSTYGTAEEELYDLTQDPYQLTNFASDPGYSTTVKALRTTLQELCDPPPPGFSFPYDALAPSAPTGLAGNAPGPTEADLSWNPSTDNVAVTGYTIYRDGLMVGTVEGTLTSFHDADLTPMTTYVYSVDAFDGAGNHSAMSDPISVTTPE